MEITKYEFGLTDIVSAVKNGEISPIMAYKKFKDFEKLLKEAHERINDNVRDEIIKNPGEYKEFSLTTRKTLNYKENEDYRVKQEELKDLEKKIKIATEMAEKGDSYVDSDGVVIEGVNVTLSEVLTYKSK